MPDSVVGVWTLLSVEFRASTGRMSHPFGPEPIGLLMVTKDGHLALQVMDPHRDSLPSGDALGATAAERANAMQGFSAYSGTWKIHENRMTIRVRTSLFPNWVGHELQRDVELKGDILQMKSTSILAGGEEVASTVRWKRVSTLE
jgi:hypothetical protein